MGMQWAWRVRRWCSVGLGGLAGAPKSSWSLGLGLVVALMALAPLQSGCAKRVKVDPPVVPEVPTEAAELDAWIAASEAQFDDIVDGAEKTIVWADPDAPERTPISLVYVHGYGATRQEVAPLPDIIAAQLGANLFYTRLTGHGETGEVFAQATVEDWVADGAEAMAVGRALGDKVVLMGTSTGGTLVTWLATQPQFADIASVVLISPNFYPDAFGVRLALLPGAERWVKMVVGEEREWTPKNDEQAKYWTWKYPSHALVDMMELVRLLELADLSDMSAPTAIYLNMEDSVVDAKVTVKRFKKIGSEQKSLTEVEGDTDTSHHVIAGDICSPETTEMMAAQISRWLEEQLGQ